MKRGIFYQTVKRVCSWAHVFLCLAVMLGGCQTKEMPLSKDAQAVRSGLLGEINKLTAALIEPVTQQDWGALRPILQKSYEEIEKSGKFVPLRIVVMDREGLTQGMVPPGAEKSLNFGSYAPAKTVFAEKRKTQAMLYLSGVKVFIVMAPLLQKEQVTGAVALGFPEEELQKWNVSEKEFLSIDFNR